MKPIVKFKKYTCRLVLTRYTYGGFPCLELIDVEDGSPVATATVNLIDYQIAPPPNHCYIKDYSENQGMINLIYMAVLMAAFFVDIP